MDWRSGLTVEEILNDLKDQFSIVVVKVNGTPVMKKEYGTFQVPDGAEVNTVDVIAGG
jgi:thiamine biosynthesis protein ThiS